MSERGTTNRRGRLSTLRQLLRDHPDDPRAWYWEIRIKTLTYCVDRHGDGESEPHDPDDYRPRPERVGTRQPVRGVRSREEIRSILLRIAAPDPGERLWHRVFRVIQGALWPNPPVSVL